MRSGGLLVLKIAHLVFSPVPLSDFGLAPTPLVLWDCSLGLFGGFGRDLVISGTAQTDWEQSIKHKTCSHIKVSL